MHDKIDDDFSPYPRSPEYIDFDNCIGMATCRLLSMENATEPIHLAYALRHAAESFRYAYREHSARFQLSRRQTELFHEALLIAFRECHERLRPLCNYGRVDAGLKSMSRLAFFWCKGREKHRPVHRDYVADQLGHIRIMICEAKSLITLDTISERESRRRQEVIDEMLRASGETILD